MAKVTWVGLAAFLLAAGVSAQDEKGDGKDLLKRALDKSSQAGGLRLEGKVDAESPFEGMGLQLGGMEGSGLTGKFTAVVGGNGTLLVKVENDKGSYECFRKKEKIVQRQTWTGKQVQPGDFPHEVSSILAFSRIAKAVDKSKDLKQAGDAKVGEVECVMVKGTLPADVIEEEPEADDAMQGLKFKMWELQKVEVAFYVGKEDGLVRKMEVKLTKGISSMIKMNMPGGGGGDEEEEDEDDGQGQPGFGNFAKMKTTRTYTCTISGYEKDLEVQLPDDVKKYFQE